jgi:hypothetical protein
MAGNRKTRRTGGSNPAPWVTPMTNQDLNGETCTPTEYRDRHAPGFDLAVVERREGDHPSNDGTLYHLNGSTARW